jgi:hypothetical protein
MGTFITQSHERGREPGPFQITLTALLVTANGVRATEVALNKIWGARNRSYLRNQLVSLGLIFSVAGALVSFCLVGVAPRCSSAGCRRCWGCDLQDCSGAHFDSLVDVLAAAESQIPPAHDVSILVGLSIELLKWINPLTRLPLKAKLRRVRTFSSP